MFHFTLMHIMLYKVDEIPMYADDMFDCNFSHFKLKGNIICPNRYDNPLPKITIDDCQFDKCQSNVMSTIPSDGIYLELLY